MLFDVFNEFEKEVFVVAFFSRIFAPEPSFAVSAAEAAPLRRTAKMKVNAIIANCICTFFFTFSPPLCLLCKKVVSKNLLLLTLIIIIMNYKSFLIILVTFFTLIVNMKYINIFNTN